MAESRPRTTRTRLALLELLVAVDGHGSISAAARALGISQPTASDGLGDLERRLGLELLVRGPRGTHLTEAGVMDADRLYEAPFTDHAPHGPEDLFSGSDVDELVAALNAIRATAGPAEGVA